ncbi:Site-specific recombinase XerD [Pseudomonas savastanoi pv. glycinea]|uniref:tyrosine-type recombinase/integrase n=1 Tax=Pseudomonas quasicaspiana TaxID=2829821 RepID=UPI000F3BB4A3|nr:site-specific integrase [Pseudomonas quasicaspiana]MCD5976803.1 site-specific integrase [Pseudomonas quasicaspiana]RMR02624.1 Site-specific recombinase XerD [Pseudomonas savastanoi pv. glycinea]
MYSISDLLTAYLDDKDLKPSSKQSYGVACRALIRYIGDCIVEEIDRKTINKWRNQVLRVTIKEVSWNTYIRHLRSLYQFAIDFGLIGLTKNPFDNCSVKCPKRPKKTVDSEVIDRGQRYLATAEREEATPFHRSYFYPAWFWSTVFDTLLYTGIRAGELLSIKREDIDLRKGIVLISADTSKGFSERRIPIHESLLPSLWQLVHEATQKKVAKGEQLFNINKFSARHRRLTMNMNQLEAFYKRMSDRLNVKVSPHRFRHTLASSLMKEPDRDIHTVKDLMGHKNLSTTLGYIEVGMDQMRSLVNGFRCPC